VCEISLNVQCYEKISNEKMGRLNVKKVIPLNSNSYMFQINQNYVRNNVNCTLIIFVFKFKV
jgi:hypothetical protein